MEDRLTFFPLSSSVLRRPTYPLLRYLFKNPELYKARGAMRRRTRGKRRQRWRRKKPLLGLSLSRARGDESCVCLKRRAPALPSDFKSTREPPPKSCSFSVQIPLPENLFTSVTLKMYACVRTSGVSAFSARRQPFFLLAGTFFPPSPHPPAASQKQQQRDKKCARSLCREKEARKEPFVANSPCLIKALFVHVNVHNT